ncbi:MAG: TlpA disulfide reductase family protein [Caldimonas sp.]
MRARRSALGAVAFVILVAVAVARLAFVFEERLDYFASPWSILDLRDGGWDFEAGIIVAWLVALLAMRRQRSLRAPLLVVLGTASVAWAVGSVVLAMGARAQPLPILRVATPGGLAAALVAFRGKPVLVNLWATWCAPCRRELPLLRRAQAAHPEIHVVFLNQGEPTARVRGFLAARGYDLRNVLLDENGEVGSGFGAGALPTTLLLDARGRLIGSHVGELSSATLAEALATLGAAGNR